MTGETSAAPSAALVNVASSELILGGQRSGKTARAESLAKWWLQGAADREAVYVATAQALDEEMVKRIARHQSDRASAISRMTTVEEPRELAQTIRRHSTSRTLLVVDCVTLWLTNLMAADAQAWEEQGQRSITEAVTSAKGPIVLVSNEIGLGVVPLGSETRSFVDALGRVNQAAAAACERVTLMVAGLPLLLKGSP